MKPIPMWMMLLHLWSFVASWVLCVALGLVFGAEVGWTVFAITEVRCAVAVEMHDRLAARRKGVLS